MEKAEKLKMLIVEDEEHVRELLKVCVSWDELGVEIVGEAGSGLEGLEMVKVLKPDIVFTDICMPFMDGIEFSRNVMEVLPKTKIVVVTGHDDFEYAKNSVKIGISDFILKPVNEEEIESLIGKLKQKIYSDRNKEKENARLQRYIEENMSFLKERALNSIVSGKLDEKGICDKLSFYCIKLRLEYIQVAVIEAGRSEDGEVNEEEEIFGGLQCLELAQQYFRSDKDICLFFDNNKRIVILNSNSKVDFITCCEELLSMLINKQKYIFSIGVGNSYTSIIDISSSYKEARSASRYRVNVGWNQVIYYSDVSSIDSVNTSFDLQNIEELSFNIKAGLIDEINNFIQNIGGTEDSVINMSIDSMRVIASNIISTVLSVLNEYGLKLQTVFTDGTQPYEKVFKIDNLPELKKYLMFLIKKSVEAIKNYNKNRTGKLIDEVKEYIDRNYVNCEISLSSTAQHFFINASYLSRTFKEEIGQNFSDYLIMLRIEKAKRLFKETNLHSYQVGEEVGINDPKYFSLCFKKYAGISVNEFKKI